MDLRAIRRHQIDQSAQQKITLGAEPLHLAFARYPLISEDLEHRADLLKHLPSQASALLF
jgi:hypothetical protein